MRAMAWFLQEKYLNLFKIHSWEGIISPIFKIDYVNLEKYKVDRRQESQVFGCESGLLQESLKYWYDHWG